MPIVEEPRPYDDLWTPDFLRFCAGAAAVLAALWAAFGLRIVVRAGCFSGECPSDEDALGFAIYGWIWLLPQVALTLATIVGFIYLWSDRREHRVAMTISSIGTALTLSLLGAVGAGLWIGGAFES